MDNDLQFLAGETYMGKTKTSITVDDKVWTDFSIAVIRKEGGRKLSDVIESLLREYIKNNGDDS